MFNENWYDSPNHVLYFDTVHNVEPICIGRWRGKVDLLVLLAATFAYYLMLKQALATFIPPLFWLSVIWLLVLYFIDRNGHVRQVARLEVRLYDEWLVLVHGIDYSDQGLKLYTYQKILYKDLSQCYYKRLKRRLVFDGLVQTVVCRTNLDGRIDDLCIDDLRLDDHIGEMLVRFKISAEGFLREQLQELEALLPDQPGKRIGRHRP